MLLAIQDSQVTWLEGKEVIWGFQNMCVSSGTCVLKREGSWNLMQVHELGTWWTHRNTGALTECSVLENNTRSIH